MQRGPRLALAGALAACLGGCPGEIDRPERFEPDAARCVSGINVETEIFQRRCGSAGCHEAGDAAAARLDLASPNVASRLFGAATDPLGLCRDRVLVNPSNHGDSVLLDKFRAIPSCGAQMPLLEAPLTRREVECVRAWIASVAPRHDAGGGMDVAVRADAGADVGMDAAAGDAR